MSCQKCYYEINSSAPFSPFQNKIDKVIHNYFFFPNFDFNFFLLILFQSEEQAKSRANKEAHLSFPSGHASFSAQAATFVVLYLQTKFITKNNSDSSSHTSYFSASIISLLAILAAGFVSVSRIMDNKHHPTDALVGSLIGILTQICLNLRILLFFNQEPIPQNRSPESMALNKMDTINNDESNLN